MSEPTNFPPPKRLRWTNEPEPLPPDITQLDSAVIGYKSLPLELRDQIRGHVIEDVERDRLDIFECPCPTTTRLSPFACIDTEWQAAIEPITFKSLYLKRNVDNPFDELDLFAQRVVGNRRHYLQLVSLPCIVRSLHNVKPPQISETLIRRLFSCMDQWHEVAARDQDFHLHLVPLNPYRRSPSLPRNGVENQISGMPVISRVTKLSVRDNQDISAQGFLNLVSHLPQLKHMTIDGPGIDCGSLGIEIGENEDNNRAQVLFDRLYQNTPKLESLRISVYMNDSRHFQAEYREAIMSYSQKLSELDLTGMYHEATLHCFSPFCAGNYDPLAASPLSWPNLKTLCMGLIIETGGGQADVVERMTGLMLPIARAVRHMPLIQELSFVMEYFYPESDGSDESAGSDESFGGAAEYYIFVNLRVFRDDVLRGQRAVLSITQDWIDPELNLVEGLVSDTVKEVWRKSLLGGANAVLEFDVGCKPGLCT